MREAGLCAKGKRHRAVTTRRDLSHPVAPHLFQRDFTATEPNKKMGDRHHLYSYSTRLALSGSDPGSVFTGSRGMVDVGLL